MASSETKILIGAPYLSHMADALASTVADFIEVNGWPDASPAFASLAQKFPVAINAPTEAASELNEQDCSRFTAAVERIARPLWVSLPVSCSQTADGRIRLPEHFPPLYTPEFLKVVIENACRLRASLPCPLQLENAASFFSVDYPQMRGPEFLRSAAEKCQCSMTMNVSAVWLQAHYVGRKPEEYAAEFPLDRVTTLRVSGIAEDRDLQAPVAAPARVDDAVLSLAAWIAHHTPARAISYNAVSQNTSRETVLQSLQAIREAIA